MIFIWNNNFVLQALLLSKNTYSLADLWHSVIVLRKYEEISAHASWSTSHNLDWLDGHYFFFLAFMALLTVQLKRVTGTRVRERGSDMQQGDQGRESNPGPLQSLSTWDARSTNWPKQRPDGHFWWTIWSSCSQNSSIGLRSGDCAGHSITDTVPADCFFPE